MAKRTGLPEGRGQPQSTSAKPGSRKFRVGLYIKRADLEGVAERTGASVKAITAKLVARLPETLKLVEANLVADQRAALQAKREEIDRQLAEMQVPM